MNYFDQRAEKYLEKSDSFFWSYFRRKEKKQIEAQLSPAVGMKLLDLGCGAGYYSLYFKEKYNLDVLGVDNSAAMISVLSRNKIRCIQSEIETFLSDEKFNLILMAGVLEFVDKPENVFFNISTMLSHGGRCVLLVPRKNIAGAIYKYHHALVGCRVNLRSKGYYLNLANNHGLQVEQTTNATIMSQVLCFSKV